MNKKRNTRPAAHIGSALALGAAVVTGCGSGASSPPGGDVASSYDNLTTDLSICQKSRDTCLDAADGARPKMEICQDELSECRTAVKAAKEEIHTALRACVDAAKACLSADGGTGDGGMPPFRACGEAFHACVKAALPPPPPLPPCAAELKACLAPSSDGGRADPRACFGQYRTCAIAELPPCAQGFATCLEQGGDFRDCATAAYECRNYRLTHDGGVPPPP